MSIETFSGREITKARIKRIKEILKIIMTRQEFKLTYKGITDLEDLSDLHDTLPKDERLVLADDWFLCYKDAADYIEFIEWASTKQKENKFNRTLEMLRIFRNILLQNKDKYFKADMIHTTSYRLYKSMLQKGLLEEISHSCYPTYYAEHTIRHIIKEIDKKSNPETLAAFLESNEEKYREYLQFFVHDITFKPTALFFEKYEKTLRPNS